MRLIRDHRQHGPVLRALTGIVVVTPFFFLVRNLMRHWEEIDVVNLDPNWWGIAAAIFTMLTGFSLLPIGTRLALEIFEKPPSFRVIYGCYFFSQAAKYLPGGLWVVPGRVAVFRRYGVPAAASGAGILIELYYLIAAGCVAFMPYLVIVGGSDLPFRMPIFLGWIVLFSIGLFPRIANPLLSFVLQRTRYRESKVVLSFRTTIRMFGLYLCFWLVAGLGFSLLVKSVYTGGLVESAALGSAFAVAWVIGFLAFLTPGGLGVREGALAVLLAPVLPAPLPAMVAVLSRFWWTISEVLAMAIAVVSMRGLRRGDVSTQDRD